MMVVSSALSSDHGFLLTGAAPGGRMVAWKSSLGFLSPTGYVMGSIHFSL